MFFPFASVSGMQSVFGPGTGMAFQFQKLDSHCQQIHIHFTGQWIDPDAFREAFHPFRVIFYVQ